MAAYEFVRSRWIKARAMATSERYWDVLLRINVDEPGKKLSVLWE